LTETTHEPIKVSFVSGRERERWFYGTWHKEPKAIRGFNLQHLATLLLIGVDLTVHCLTTVIMNAWSLALVCVGHLERPVFKLGAET